MSAGLSANEVRGEALLTIAGHPHVLRPSFTALVAAEEELGPLFALVERPVAAASCDWARLPACFGTASLIAGHYRVRQWAKR